ncbi:putative oxidoreductase [Micromonospora echinaurantiaca]|uniref:Putative oxidoreductase n=1 Tax=Micromonospora echinaurantiaca TaxID=47857 RepID=A0A1C5I218_9ACTN|nr:DoxX family protein [Micromonospora echinaurantiaca]SCG52303.1 putative oxidoreductase [Micromonospora echinaurantiaca]
MRAEQIVGPAVSLFRAVIGLLFLCHGLASLFGVLGGNRGTGEAIPLGQWPGWWAALIQGICGALVLLGLLTRPAAILASGSMAYAYFMVHQPDALLPLRNGGELAVLFCWSFLLIAVLGPGAWALDSLLRTRRADRAPVPAR